MIVDTHVHLLPSKLATPDWADIKLTLDVAHARGIDCLCVTEHLDALHWEMLMVSLFDSNIFGGEILAPGVVRLQTGLTLSAGAEIALKGGGEVGVHSDLTMLSKIPRGKMSLTLPELAAVCNSHMIEPTIIAHHVYWGSKWIYNIGQYRDIIAAVEVPAKDRDNSARYINLANQLEKAAVGSSDAHAWPQVGAGITKLLLPPENFSVPFLARNLHERSCEFRISSESAAMIKIGKEYRIFGTAS